MNVATVITLNYEWTLFGLGVSVSDTTPTLLHWIMSFFQIIIDVHVSGVRVCVRAL
jgi:hypothetical protein